MNHAETLEVLRPLLFRTKKAWEVYDESHVIPDEIEGLRRDWNEALLRDPETEEVVKELTILPVLRGNLPLAFLYLVWGEDHKVARLGKDAFHSAMLVGRKPSGLFTPEWAETVLKELDAQASTCFMQISQRIVADRMKDPLLAAGARLRDWHRTQSTVSASKAPSPEATRPMRGLEPTLVVVAQKPAALVEPKKAAAPPSPPPPPQPSLPGSNPPKLEVRTEPVRVTPPITKPPASDAVDEAKVLLEYEEQQLGAAEAEFQRTEEELASLRKEAGDQFRIDTPTRDKLAAATRRIETLTETIALAKGRVEKARQAVDKADLGNLDRSLPTSLPPPEQEPGELPLEVHHVDTAERATQHPKLLAVFPRAQELPRHFESPEMQRKHDGVERGRKLVAFVNYLLSRLEEEHTSGEWKDAIGPWLEGRASHDTLLTMAEIAFVVELDRKASGVYPGKAYRVSPRTSARSGLAGVLKGLRDTRH